ncbi:G-protein coupled receptor family C group 6 member A-like [Gastrophryne carolinensis]
MTLYEMFSVNSVGDTIICNSFSRTWDILKRLLSVENMIQTVSMIYAIERINNSTLLPGIKLGYKIYDTCANILKAVRATMRLIPGPDENPSTDCRFHRTVFPVSAVLGETFSEISIPVARLLGNYLIPQISPVSASSTLNDKVKFPSFLSTMQDNKYQTIVIVKLIKAFQWNWVGIISSDDDYGKSTLNHLNTQFENQEICPAFSSAIPSYIFSPNLASSIDAIISKIESSKTNVVVLAVSKVAIVNELLRECIKRNISKTWIATSSWSTSKDVFNLENFEMVGTILGVQFKTDYVRGFEAYLKQLLPLRQGTDNKFLLEYQVLRFQCTKEYQEYLECKNSTEVCTMDPSISIKSPLACQEENPIFSKDDFLIQQADWSLIYSTYLAVHVIAQAIQRLLCKRGICRKKDIIPSQLLEEIKKSKFTYNKETFSFSSTGELFIGYDVVNWQLVNNTKTFTVIANYSKLDGELFLNESLILWNTEDNEVPFSNCSESCPPGSFKKHSNITCCYECVVCPENQYTPDADMNECLKCHYSQWSMNGSSSCINRKKEFFRWKDTFAITLVTFSALGVLVVLAACFLFVINAGTPVVKAAGGPYSYLLMTSLFCSIVSIGLFIGKPNDTICKIRQPFFGISFTISVSCTLVKSVRIILASNLTSQGQIIVKLTHQPIIMIATLTGIQILICIIWLVLKGPAFSDIYTTPQTIFLTCNEGSNVAFGIMLGYIGFLALLAFILAYRGRKLPQQYNETRLIAFSMLVYMFVWILFIPIYVKTQNGVYLSVVEAVAILASVYGMIACQLLPVCYIIIFKKDTLTQKPYLQSVCMFCIAKQENQPANPITFEDFPTTSKEDAEAVQIPQKCSCSYHLTRKRHKSF